MAVGSRTLALPRVESKASLARRLGEDKTSAREQWRRLGRQVIHRSNSYPLDSTLAKLDFTLATRLIHWTLPSQLIAKSNKSFE